MSYIGTQPNNVKENIGLYNPSEILLLTKDGSWGGSLDLIQSQTTSSTPSSVNFTDIKGALYDVHLLTFFNSLNSAGGQTQMRFSNDGGSSFESSN